MIKIEGKKFDWFGLTQILKEHKGKLRQIRMLSVNELKKKYKGAALGPLWALIKPTFTLFILWFAFEIGLKRNGGVHFINGKYTQFVFMLTGYVPWFYISECIVGGSRSIRSNKQFVTKLSFPVSNIMTFTSLSGLYIHILLCAIMYVVLLCLGFGPSIYNLQFIYYALMM
ncbi:ABC transporter permease, partial [Ruminococcus sp.]